MTSRVAARRESPSIGTWSQPVLLVLLILLWSLPSGAANFNVNTTYDHHDSNPGDGVCQSTQLTCSVRAAVEEANALPGTDTIYVGSDSYTIGSPLELTSSLTIDGQSSGATEISGGGIERVFELTGSAVVTLQDMRVTAGWENSPGGLITVGEDASLTLSGCMLSLGLATEGGCIYTEGDLTLNSTSIHSCDAGDIGGAIAIRGGTTSIGPQCEINNNGATNGGGISIGYGNLIIDTATIQDNSADPSTGLGGGIYIVGAGNTVYRRITNSKIYNNSAADGGGIYQTGHNYIVVESSSFSGNSATVDGGAYHFDRGEIENSWFVNTTFTGNSAGNHGGAVYSGSDGFHDVELYNCTLTGNTADDDGDGNGDGGGVARGGSAEVNMTNSLIAGNSDGSNSGTIYENPDCWGSIKSEGYNLLGEVSAMCFVGGVTTGNLSGSTATPLNPMLAPATSCWGGYAHQLLAGSPARDAGNPSGCWGPEGEIFTDQCGENRPVGSRCDIGAVEAQDAPSDIIFSDGFESGNTSAWD